MCYSSVWNNRTYIISTRETELLFVFLMLIMLCCYFFIEDNTGIKRASFILFIILFMFMSLVKKEPTNFSASKFSLEKFKNARWWMFFRAVKFVRKDLEFLLQEKSYYFLRWNRCQGKRCAYLLRFSRQKT